VNAVVVAAACSDACCEGLKDPSKHHWLVDMWPGIQRTSLTIAGPSSRKTPIVGSSPQPAQELDTWQS
jgi:hypothetical protein